MRRQRKAIREFEFSAGVWWSIGIDAEEEKAAGIRPHANCFETWQQIADWANGYAWANRDREDWEVSYLAFFLCDVARVRSLMHVEVEK